jgi:chemotaxis protein methyltransferase CheR
LVKKRSPRRTPVLSNALKRLLESTADHAVEATRGRLSQARLVKAFQTKIMPAIIKGKMQAFQRELKIWSAGCADGEEPYTIAISVMDALSYNLDAFKIEVVATDLDPQSLNRARRGVYSPARLRLAKHSVLQRFFTPVDAGNLKISDEVKRLVTFQPHDLFTLPPSSPFDVISCRNVMIYFSRELQQTLFHNFHQALSPGGYLILGKVESPVGDYGTLFRCVDLAERIYQKA